MKLTVSGRKSVMVGVDTVVASVCIYSEGMSERDNKESATVIADEISSQYKEEYPDSLVSVVLSDQRFRFIDSDGVMFMKSTCLFEIRQEGSDILLSLSILESICNNMGERARLTGWKTQVSKELREASINKVVSGVFNDALAEIGYLKKSIGVEDFCIDNVSIKSFDPPEEGYSVVLPDFSSEGRGLIFDSLPDIVTLQVEFCREMTLDVISK